MNPPSLTVTETRDWQLVWHLSQHPAVKDRITDDAWTQFPHEVLVRFVEHLVANPANHVLLVSLAGKPAGCFVLDSRGDGLFEVHTMLLPSCRGADALAAGKQAIQSAFQLPGVEKLVSYCPAHLPEVYWYARMCGFRPAGFAAKKWIKHGQEYPLRIVEKPKAKG